MTNPHLPLISIGMPVRNEARFLHETLESLIRQRGVNLEIIISDNASTDETESICIGYCEKYPWISYHRFAINGGPSPNFNYVLNHARGDYFMWACGHDIWDDNYLLECCKELQEQPNTVLAFGTTRWIDAEGKPFARSTGWTDTRGASLVARYCMVFWGNMNPVVAMIRTADLKRRPIGEMVGGDLALLLYLSLSGDFVHVTQTGWSRREFRREVSYKEKLERYSSKEFALNTSFIGRHFPLVRLPFKILSDLYASQLSWGQKIQITLILLPSLLVKYVVDKTRKRQQVP